MRPVVITGAPRSGTSIIGGIVHHLGVDLGEHYLRPDSQNPTGYFEDAKLIEHDFKYYGTDREMWYYEVKQYLTERSQNSRMWGWKSPMLAVTIRDYKTIFEDIGISPLYIFVRREVKDIRKSKEIHHGQKDKTTETLINNLVKGLEGEDVLMVEYKEALKDTPGTVGEIIKYLKLKPNADQKTRAILSVIQPPPTEGDQILAVPSRLYK